MRRLPSIYMGKTLFFADRKVDAVVETFAWIAESLQRSLAVPTYTLHPVRIGPVHGLYARDFFNRSSFRRALVRRGVEFAPVPFATFTGERFHAEPWGHFDPKFVVMPNPDPDEPGPIATSRAELAFGLATYRLGGPGREELQKLVDIAGGIQGLSGEDVSALVKAARSDPIS